MGSEKVNPSYRPNGSNRDFTKSTQTNDHSNPQQGTGAMKATLHDKEDFVQKSKVDSHPAVQKARTSSSNNVENNRKLFVGGLPTDITDPEFRNFFSQFGELQESVVMFDRETRRSRGFGFVTYVNPDISKSLLQIGGHGDGIGRLVMRGKTCEVKAAAPKGQAPTRGGRSNRGNRGGARNQCQGETHQVSTFRPNELYPVMYQNDSFNMQYPQGAFSSVSHGPGFAPPGYHPNMHPHSYALSHGPHHGSFPLIADHDPRVEGVVGAPYFIASAIVPPSTDRFSVLNAFPPTLQIPAYHQQQDHSFLPYGPGHFQPTLPATEMATMTQPVEQNIHATEEIDDNGEGVIAIEN